MVDLSGIDPILGSALIELGTSLSTLVLKGTTTAVQGKIASLKNEKNVDTIRNAYDEMVNQLLAEREEALMIAQSYKNELERVVISDEDIEYLQQTVSKVLDLLIGVQILDVNSEDEAVQERAKAQLDAINGIKVLISKDVLKTMQLLGFNYKAAIGEPLTELCANKIKGVAGSLQKRKR
ncbi:MAG: hypothetical protein IKQ44_08075 [Lachnospiraceae bacterium]|nr:hypothetical protein [Lachnospiraceae bacterium]